MTWGRAIWGGDAAERAFFFRTLFYTWPVFIVANGFLAYFLLEKERISEGVFSLMTVAGIPVGLGFSLATWWILGRASQGFVQLLLGAGNIPPGPSFSLEESLMARGEYDHARQTLEDRLREGKDLVAIQLRLADLHGRLLRDTTGAERWYLAARAANPDPRQAWEITNGLVDLYRAAGARGRLMAELARLADSWPATRAGQDARRELRELKAGAQ